MHSICGLLTSEFTLFVYTQTMQSYMSTQSRQPDPAFTWSNMLTQSQQPDPDNHIVVHADTQSTTRPNQPYMPTYIRQPGTLLQQANRLLGRPPPSFIWSRSTINHIKVGVSRSTSFQYASGKLSHFGQPSLHINRHHLGCKAMETASPGIQQKT